MHYYPHHIGDFIRDTARLSDSQCMTYLRLIWMYYDQEAPLVDDHESLAFQVGSDPASVRQILDHFFQLDANAMRTHKRCDQVIAEYRAKSEKAAKSASARWKNANAMRTHTERNANASKIDANQEPITNKEKNISPNGDRQPSADQCPHHEIIALYSQKLPTLTKPLLSRWSGSKGAEALRTRWREDKRHQSLEFWEWFFGIVAQSRFHLGENDRGWKADLPWLLKRENFDKILAKGAQQ